MFELRNDVRHIQRMFARNPGFVGIVVVTLMLGIGVTSAVFTIFNSVLLRPLPYPNPEELVRVYDTQPSCADCYASFPEYHDWRANNHVFAAMGAGVVFGSVTLTGSGNPQKLLLAQTTASLAAVYRVKPLFGRWYSEEEDQPGGPHIVVLSFAFWNRQFNRDRQILGRKLILNGYPCEVAGVMPENFSFQDFSRNEAELFMPLQRRLDPAGRQNHFLSVFARLRKGATLEQASR